MSRQKVHVPILFYISLQVSTLYYIFTHLSPLFTGHSFLFVIWLILNICYGPNNYFYIERPSKYRSTASKKLSTDLAKWWIKLLSWMNIKCNWDNMITVKRKTWWRGFDRIVRVNPSHNYLFLTFLFPPNKNIFAGHYITQNIENQKSRFLGKLRSKLEDKLNFELNL